MLAFLHTAAVHVPSFDRIARKLDSSVPIRHAVREDLLAQALADGEVTEQTLERTRTEVQRLIREGARVVLCTCSTLGEAAEAADSPAARVLRVDRPMAERAVILGCPILVVAATPTAMTSAIALLRASSQGTSPPLRELMCSSAWERFLAGDHSGYASALAEQVHEHARPGDVVMLAQASMSAAAALIRRSYLQVLSSPETAVQRALSLLLPL